VANCFLGALPPVDLRAVCLVRAIANLVDRFHEVSIESEQFIDWPCRQVSMTQVQR
jgi:hypothetical protein